MTAKEIRQSFIDFFKEKNHTFVPSSPVVPQDDPTLLFTNAGMNQFKDILLGKGKRPYTRAVNSQKCIRVSGKHNDLEEVGHDTYHHTFFEMLGNWSFGDYYKREAISWAWELLTSVWKIPKEKLYATVFREDDEAAQVWRQVTDIKPERILHFDEKDNFWEMGETGPCGPCSEIHIDLGESYCDKADQAHTCKVNGDCGRFIELWNLVFIQFNRDESGDLHPLPSKHVDTGAGFERLVGVLQNKRSNYETDVFTPILMKIAEITGVDYASSSEKASFHVIADHIRMLTYALADGGRPGNEGRDYVIRRILRRAARYGRKLNMHNPFIFQIVPTVIETLSDSFPVSRERAERVSSVIRTEEENFNRTLDRGLEIFDKITADLAARRQAIIPGDEVFKLYDTYGFPVDLTRNLAEEAGLGIDEQGFSEQMEEQKLRARKAAKFQTTDIPADAWVIVNENGSNRFVGYDTDEVETEILKYAPFQDKLHIILKETPFYAESGGQIGDQGVLTLNNQELKVIDTQKQGDEIVHVCPLPDHFQFHSPHILASIRSDRRRQTEKNHTATHLLHAALRRILGNHVEQAGSLVTPDRLRFDFTHHGKLETDQVWEVENLVNEKIQDDLMLVIEEESFEQARKKGAMALFGEKYGDIVRTVSVPGYSLELCGGTHVRRTGEIGAFIIVEETSIAAGIRRIEAVTGRAALHLIQNNRQLLTQIADLLNAGESELTGKIRDLIESRRQLERDLEKAASQALSRGLEDILKKAEIINGINVISYIMENAAMPRLKELGDRIREKSKNTVALLGTVNDDKINLVCIVSDDLISSKGLNASHLVQAIAGIVGGGGGGRPHMATAGGKDTGRFNEAMAEIKKLIEEFKETENNGNKY
jgi:alanyl-tRNA synthetase